MSNEPGYTPLEEWFYRGQRVKFTALAESKGYSGYGTVKKVAKKNYQVTLDSDPDGILNVPIVGAKRWIEKADADAPAPPPVEKAPRPEFGTFVRVDTMKVRKTPAGVYIVFGWARDGEYSKLLPLDGPANGRYWSVPNSALVPVKVQVTEVE